MWALLDILAGLWAAGDAARKVSSAKQRKSLGRVFLFALLLVPVAFIANILAGGPL